MRRDSDDSIGYCRFRSRSRRRERRHTRRWECPADRHQVGGGNPAAQLQSGSDDSAVRVTVRQAVTAHDVVATRQNGKPGVRADTGVDDGDSHAVAGRVLPSSRIFRMPLAPGELGHVRLGYNDQVRATGALPHGLLRPGGPSAGTIAGSGRGGGAARARTALEADPVITTSAAIAIRPGDRTSSHPDPHEQFADPGGQGQGSDDSDQFQPFAHHSTSGVNGVTGTTSAAANPAAPKPIRTSAPHSSA